MAALSSARRPSSDHLLVDFQEATGGSQEFWQATIDSLDIHLAVLDGSGLIVAVNAAWLAFAAANGGGVGLGVGADYLGVCDAAAAEEHAAGEVAAALREILSGDRNELHVLYPCDSPTDERWFVLRATPYGGSGVSGAVVAHADVTRRVLVDRQLRFQADVLDELDSAVVATDRRGSVTLWNKAAVGLFGWGKEEAHGRQLKELVVSAESADEADVVIKEVARVGRWEGDFPILRRDGSTFTAHVSDSVIRSASGEVEGFVGVSLDVSKRVEAERSLRAAENRLRAVTDAVGEGLFTLDPEGRLTYANNTAVELLGWAKTDLEGAPRMHDVTHYRHADGSAHRFEDCPITRAHDADATVRVDDDIFIRRDGTELPVSYTVAPFETDDSVRGSVVVFRDITVQKAQQLLLLEELEGHEWAGRIRDALDNDHFLLYAQPIVRIDSGETVQHEVLIRLKSGSEIVLPDEFLPVAEKFSLIQEIDRWVIARAIALVQQGRSIELNLSATSLTDITLLQTIEENVSAAGIDPAMLTFEVTETAIIQDETAAVTFLTGLREIGCRIALDDFGTGYAGFTYLKQLPLDFLKIDVEFVRDLPNDPAGRHVIEAVVRLARGFGLETIAEGVENAETLRLLSDLHVDYAQGYWLGRPEPVVDWDTTDRKGVQQ